MATPLNGSSILVLVRTAGTAFPNESVGTGNGSTTTFSHTMAHIPVLLNSVSVTAGAVTATDDGLGNLAGAGISSGSINYDTGALSITFSTAPTNGTPITTTYTQTVYTAVGYQSDATFDEKTRSVEVSSKEARQSKYYPGQYSATVAAKNLYVPSDTAFVALKNAMRNGTKVVVARQESGSEVEHASAVVTELSGSFKDQTEGLISLTMSVDGPWVVP
jgi:hypothetical protein